MMTNSLQHLALKIAQGEHIYSAWVRHNLLTGLAYFPLTRCFDYWDVPPHPIKPQDVLSPQLEAVLARLKPSEVDKEIVRDKHTISTLWRLSTDNSLSAAEVLSLRMRPNLEQNAFAYNLGWKLCPQCAEEDVRHYGYSYWYRDHQLPSVTLCFEHKLPLVSCKKLHHLESLLLPSQLVGHSLQPEPHCEALSEWSYFVIAVDRLLQVRPECVIEWKGVIHKKLQIPDSVKNTHKPFFKGLLHQFEKDLGRVLLGHLFKAYKQGLDRRPNILWATLSGMSPSRSLRHPIYWLVILYWLRDYLPEIEVCTDGSR